MADHNKIIRDYLTNKQDTVIELSVCYTKESPFRRRGFYFGVTPVELMPYKDGYVRGYSLGCGVFRLLEEVKRFSRRRFDYWADHVSKAAEVQSTAIFETLETMASAHNLELKRRIPTCMLS